MNTSKPYRLIRTEEFEDLESAMARRRELFAAGENVELRRRDGFSGTWWPVADNVA